MRVRDIIRESRVLFNAQQLAQAAEQNEFHVVEVTALPNGDIALGYWGDFAEPRRNLSVQFSFTDHKVRFRNGSHGELLLPRVQQVIRELMRAGIVDNTWKIETRSGYGYYDKTQFSKYVHGDEPADRKSLEELIDKAIRLTPESTNLVFFHGTSMADWMRIQKVGLHPLFVGSNQQHGYESRGKHELNDRVLYLASTIQKAMHYAKERSEFQSRHRGRAGRFAYDVDLAPVILRVQIPDPVRLVTDDDSLIRLAQRVSRRIWKSKTPEEKQTLMARVSAQRNLRVTDPSIGEMLWREGEGFQEIMRFFPRRAIGAWMAGLKRTDQVGYRGIIPPKFITLELQTS